MPPTFGISQRTALAAQSQESGSSKKSGPPPTVHIFQLKQQLRCHTSNLLGVVRLYTPFTS